MIIRARNDSPQLLRCRRLPTLTASRILVAIQFSLLTLLASPLVMAAGEDAQPLFFEGFELLKAGDSAAAAAKLEEGLKLDPDNPQAYFYLGEAYHDLGEGAQAREQYAASLKSDESSDVANEARQRLAELAETENTRLIQTKLNALGYATGPADGVAGARTQEAIAAFRLDNDLADDAPLLSALEQAAPRSSGGAGANASNSANIRTIVTSTDNKSPSYEDTVTWIQRKARSGFQEDQRCLFSHIAWLDEKEGLAQTINFSNLSLDPRGWDNSWGVWGTYPYFSGRIYIECRNGDFCNEVTNGRLTGNTLQLTERKAHYQSAFTFSTTTGVDFDDLDRVEAALKHLAVLCGANKEGKELF